MMDSEASVENPVDDGYERDGIVPESEVYGAGFTTEELIRMIYTSGYDPEVPL